jgi:hypothetical protein
MKNHCLQHHSLHRNAALQSSEDKQQVAVFLKLKSKKQKRNHYIAF